MSRCCWLCGRNGNGDPLEKHHIFGGALRGLSDRYGLTVYLCGERCHRNGAEAAHRSGETMAKLHRYGQLRVMEEQGWSTEDFIRHFGKSFTDEQPQKPEHQKAYFYIEEDE